MTRILLIGGSLRVGSTNEAVLRTALTIDPPEVELKLVDGMVSLPHFDPDDDPADGEPPGSKIPLCAPAARNPR